MTHGQKFDAMCAEVEARLRDNATWRAELSQRTVLILEGVEEGLRTPKMLAACRAMYEDYAPVRVANRVLFRIFMRMLKRGDAAAAQPSPTCT